MRCRWRGTLWSRSRSVLGTMDEGFTLRNKDYTKTDGLDHLQHEALSSSVFFLILGIIVGGTVGRRGQQCICCAPL